MKILLVRPRPHRETIGLQSVMICEPLELMLLSAVLKKNGHDVALADMILEKQPFQKVMERHRPDAVCLTGYISHINVMKRYADIAKEVKPDVCVAVGGVHAAVCPQDFDHRSIDIVCPSETDLYTYLGCGDQAPLFPDRKIVSRYADRYYYLFQEKCALIKTSFGCPYACNFCFCKEIAPYRARPVSEVIEELLEIPQEEVYIVDDNFLFDRERLLEFCRRIEESLIWKHFLVYGRASFIAENEDIIARLKGVGLSAVIVGIEAADQVELDAYGKGVTVEQNIKAIEILRKHGIECYATVILGPDWVKADFDRLYRFIQDRGLVFVNLQPFTPMPGTPYFDRYKDSLIIPYTEHEKWDMAHLVIKPGKMSVRSYYWHILLLYYKITMRPKSAAYMLRKYGIRMTLKLSLGAARITAQYLRKILSG